MSIRRIRQTSKQNTDIYVLTRGKYSYTMRCGNNVDQYWAQKYIDLYPNPIFTTCDIKSDNVINMPLGFMPHNSISKDPNYIFEHHNNNKYFGKIFWRGRVITHDIRSKIVNYFIHQQSPYLDIQNWDIDTNKYGIYGQSHLLRPPKYQYVNYFNGLKNSDFFLVIRGDKPWTFSFMDCLRAGSIPICIDTFYQDMGWQNININPEDLFLYFKTDKDSVEKIYHKCLQVLQDKERVLFMKKNINNFYKKYILAKRKITNHKGIRCWSHFLNAKIREIKRNNYRLLNNQFISSIINEMV